ncbi:DNA polymerase IV [Ferroacidibacillus organovorans]|uniref:DNA polymerase IV n=1 Tax=Ferroacidibacillus organovorans TaxID=1765683 RepID=A0A101XU01_9BACL|nr:DNA polymerase IV [Ferroacidibacillus organovorans]KUO97436.1 DNA polymerase IV [Ferroacidibacillus organovorans]
MTLIYGLVDMQSFYASCEVASRPEFTVARRMERDDSDPLLVVAGDPARRSGIILAATPPAKTRGITTAMRLGEALRLVPELVVAAPRMQLYIETSTRIQQTIREYFPLQEQFSVDESFFAFPHPSALFGDPVAAARSLQQAIWDQFRVRCRIGLAPNKWMAKVANNVAKKTPGGIVWWPDGDLESLHNLPVSKMWGLRKRAQVLELEFGTKTIGDVSRISRGALRDRFGAWGDVIYRWSHGEDPSPIHPNAYDAPHKSYSHRVTLPRDFYQRDEAATVILELLDEVCHRLRRAGQRGRRVGLGITYARFEGGFYRARALTTARDDAHSIYPTLLALLDQHWSGEGIRAISVSVDDLKTATDDQLSLFEDIPRRVELNRAIDLIHERYGKTSLYRATSLTAAGQLLLRSKKIGGHWSGAP